MVDTCRLLDVWGSPRQRGEQYGAAAAGEIREGVGHYLTQMAGSGLGEGAVSELAEAYLPIIADFDASHVDEMRGIAAGADVPMAHIVLLNARTELLKMAGNPALRAGLALECGTDGCTTVIVQPERARDGHLIHAHNWDWKATCAKTCVILRIRNDDGPDILTFTEAGGLARFGFNSAGIAITGNYLEWRARLYPDRRAAGVDPAQGAAGSQSVGVRSRRPMPRASRRRTTWRSATRRAASSTISNARLTRHSW